LLFACCQHDDDTIVELVKIHLLVFFFSSRRRHTRCYRDWSSDVCSSDLSLMGLQVDRDGAVLVFQVRIEPTTLRIHGVPFRISRSEERRVGKETRSVRARRPSKTTSQTRVHPRASPNIEQERITKSVPEA